MISLVDYKDLHPISLHQINNLCLGVSSMSKFKALFRIKKDEPEFRQKYPGIKVTKEFFNDKVVAESEKEGTSKIYVCGPPMMNTGIAQALKENGKFDLLELV